MTSPLIHSTIDRRVLVSYAIDPAVVARLLPAGLRPTLHNGVAVGGICLIRLTDVRPFGVPRRLGLATENVAHRFAVEWDGPGGVETGVYIARRDTSSVLTAALGGRLFPGVHARGRFVVQDAAGHIDIAYRSNDGAVALSVSGDEIGTLPDQSLFDSVDDASEFFRRAPVGLSPNRHGTACESMELHASSWRVRPLALSSVASSWFDDVRRFPPGSIHLDSALVMRGIDAEWAPAVDRHFAVQ